MASKLNFIEFILLFGISSTLFVGCKCEPDVYGGNILLEIPITIEVNTDTLSGGDTIWVHADFDKEVLEKKSGIPIFLENFQFFTKISFSEISGDTENYLPLGIISDIGTVEEAPLSTSVVYPITYEESEDHYKFRAGMIVPTQRGLYRIGLSTLNLLYESYDHPVVFQCGDNRRSVINVSYKNNFSTRENFENIFLNTRVPYLLELTTLENYQSGGSVAFYVR